MNNRLVSGLAGCCLGMVVGISVMTLTFSAEKRFRHSPVIIFGQFNKVAGASCGSLVGMIAGGSVDFEIVGVTRERVDSSGTECWIVEFLDVNLDIDRSEQGYFIGEEGFSVAIAHMEDLEDFLGRLRNRNLPERPRRPRRNEGLSELYIETISWAHRTYGMHWLAYP